MVAQQAVNATAPASEQVAPAAALENEPEQDADLAKELEDLRKAAAKKEQGAPAEEQQGTTAGQQVTATDEAEIETPRPPPAYRDDQHYPLENVYAHIQPARTWTGVHEYQYCATPTAERPR